MTVVPAAIAGSTPVSDPATTPPIARSNRSASAPIRSAVVAVRAASGVPLPEAARAASALLVFGGALFALRDPDRFAPPTPWLAYVAAGGTALYAAALLS